MTQQPMGMPPSQQGLSRRTIVWLIAAILAVVVVAAGYLIHLPYVIFRPGPAQNTLGQVDKRDVVTVSGHPTYPTSGTLDFTTVSVYGGPSYPVNVWQWLRAKADKNAEIMPEETVFPKNITGKEVQQQNAEQMTGSQEFAEVVAIRAAGGKVNEVVSVGQIGPGTPAAKVLKVGDRIETINGQPASTLVTLRAQMAKVKAGSPAKVVVTRSGKQLTLSVGTQDDDGRAVMGIAPNPKYTFPYTVKVNAGDVGGPSAGMMFTLAIYDKLTPGALTGGKKFAGTGTIGPDGTVGPIGGIRQKLVGARNSGADYFLAPAGDCDEVKGHVPDGLHVYKVSTFDQARSAIQQVAAGKGAALDTCG